MTEKEIKAEMRLRALEGLVTTLLAVHCVTVAPDDSVASFAKMRKQLAATAQSWVFSDLDPVMSDHHAAELEAALDRQLEFASKQIVIMQRVLRGEA